MNLYVTTLGRCIWEVGEDIKRHDCPGEGRTFGITWDKDRLFVSRPNRIDVFNKSLQFLHSLPVRVDGDIHQILAHGNMLWGTCPKRNCLIQFNLNTEELRFFLPVEEMWSKETPPIVTNDMKYKIGGAYHYNSLLFSEDTMYVMANNNSFPSFILEIDLKSMKIKNKMKNTGRESHNLCLIGQELFYLDSRGSRALRSQNQEFIITDDSYFLRGLAATENNFYIGAFPFRTVRSERESGDSYLYTLDVHGHVQEITILPESGDICDIRCVDTYDFAHRKEPYENELYVDRRNTSKGMSNWTKIFS